MMRPKMFWKTHRLAILQRTLHPMKPKCYGRRVVVLLLGVDSTWWGVFRRIGVQEILEKAIQAALAQVRVQELMLVVVAAIRREWVLMTLRT